MTEYREVLQNPHIAFKEPDLQNAIVKQTPLGLPSLVSGGFALTACVTTQAGTNWAIRCFHKEVSDLQDRYRYISDFLDSKNDEFFVKFKYEPEGIKVSGDWYPIVKMAWIDGQSLDEFIRNNLDNPSCLQNLASQIKLISGKLRGLKMAHGDLQHGNILVRKNGKLVLIDYDGMYVPRMPYARSNELGHISFQHPGRNDSFFNEEIDNFSSIAIYVSLCCLATSKGRELWKYHTGENLIFSRRDYQDPGNSALFAEIRRDSQLRAMIDRFQQICLGQIQDVPSLAQFLSDSIQPPKPQEKKPVHLTTAPGFQGQLKVFSAHEILHLVNQDGEKITVVGRVDHVTEWREEFKVVATFINFGNLQRDSVRKTNLFARINQYRPFTTVIFAKGLDNLLKVKNLRSSNLRNFEGKYLKITGLLERVEYKPRGYCTPQIVLENPYQLVEVTKEEADRLLAGVSTTSSPVPPPPPPPPLPRTTRSPSPSPPPVPPLPPHSPSTALSKTSPPTNSKDCFVITATFGTPCADEVLKYRCFRDKYLCTNRLGRFCIRIYYCIGPVLAQLIESAPPLRRLMAKVLGKIAEFLPEDN